MCRNGRPEGRPVARDRGDPAHAGQERLRKAPGAPREVGAPARPVHEDRVDVEPRNADAAERATVFGLHLLVHGLGRLTRLCLGGLRRRIDVGARLARGRRVRHVGRGRCSRSGAGVGPVLGDGLVELLRELVLLPPRVQVGHRIPPEVDRGAVDESQQASREENRPDPAAHLHERTVAARVRSSATDGPAPGAERLYGLSRCSYA